MNEVTVSIVIPTYGRAEYLKDLVLSVRESTPSGAYEIVVVSSDLPDSEKVKWLSDQKDVVLILADERRKSGGRKKSLYYYTNLGIKRAKKDWVFVVNDDMYFDKKWHLEFTDTLSKKGGENIGMVIVATHIGGREFGLRTAKIGRTKKAGGEWKDLYLSDLSIIKKDVLEKIGYFDENLDWFGSGADNSLAVEFLTDKDTVVNENIKVEHFISDELRKINTGSAYDDFNYIKRKWDRWSKKNNCKYDCNFNMEPYTLIYRIKNILRKCVKKVPNRP